jgi:hypothetical protein
MYTYTHAHTHTQALDLMLESNIHTLPLVKKTEEGQETIIPAAIDMLAITVQDIVSAMQYITLEDESVSKGIIPLKTVL